MKTINEIEEELRMKEQRVAYWEQYHILPRTEKLAVGGE